MAIQKKKEDIHLNTFCPYSYFFLYLGTLCLAWAAQVVLVVKNPLANAADLRDAGLTPGLGRSPRGGHGNQLHYSCLENPTDKEAWQVMSIGSQRVRHS